MRLSFLIVFSILSFSAVLCLGGRVLSLETKKQKIEKSNLQDSTTTVKSKAFNKINPWRLIGIGRLRRPYFAETMPIESASEIGLLESSSRDGMREEPRTFQTSTFQPPLSKLRRSRVTEESPTKLQQKDSPESSHDKMRLFEEFQTRTLLPYFTQVSADDSSYLSALSHVSKQRAFFKDDNTKNPASKEFLETFCLLKGTAGDEIEEDDNFGVIRRCVAQCISRWGYFFIPDKEFKSGLPLDIFAHGKIIPLVRGELIPNQTNKGKRKQTESDEESVTCVCSTNEEFTRVLDQYGISSKKFARLKNKSALDAKNFLVDSTESKALEVISYKEFCLRVTWLLQQNRVPLSADMSDKQQRQRLKAARGESEEEVGRDEDLSELEFYRAKKLDDSPPIGDEFLRELIEKLENISKQPNSGE